MRYLYVLQIEKAQQFTTIGDFQDDREGMWYVDVRMYKADLEGNLLNYLDYYTHSGLWRLEKDAHFAALEKARASRVALIAVGKKAYLEDLGSDYDGSDEYLGFYLWQREAKAKRRAKAKRLREEAKVLLGKARALA